MKYVVLTKSGKETFPRIKGRVAWGKIVNKCDECNKEHKLPIFSCNSKVFCSEVCMDKQYPRSRYV